MFAATLLDVTETDLERLVQSLLTDPDGLHRMRLDLGLDRDGFLEFCERHPQLFAELEPDGSVTIMSPLVTLSAEHEDEAIHQLKVWHRDNGRPGRVYGASAGWTLPSGAVKSPDACWISPETLSRVPPEEFERFARLVPDFVIEVRSKSDKLERVKAKMTDTWMDAGVRLAWLIDPRRRRVYVYRPGAEVETVTDFGGTLSAGEVVPGFAMDLSAFA